MSSIYLCDVVGDGQSPATAYRPDLPAGANFVALMVHEGKRKAVVLADDDTLSGTGVRRLVTAPTVTQLRAQARTTNPTATQRSVVANWLSANGYAALPASAVSWLDVIHHVARQVNPAADLDVISTD